MIKADILISVIVPAYNSAASIENAVDSVINQENSYNIKEIIIINDGSKDNTSDVVKEIIKNNKTSISILLIEQENMGVSAARNNGIKASKGNWIGLLDADDTWLQNKITEQVKVVKNYPEIKVIGSNRNNTIKKHGKKINNELYKLNITNQLFSYWPGTSSLLINKCALYEIGLFDETRSHAEDSDLLLRITPRYNAYYLYGSLVKMADKPIYGHSGLSADNKAMHKGSLLNVKNTYNRHDINFIQFTMFTLWEEIKYIRRIIITFLQNNKSRELQ